MTSIFRLLVLVSALLVAWPVSLSYAKDVTPKHANQCVKVGKISKKGYAILTEIQHNVEVGPLYMIPAASLGVLECRMKEVDRDDLILDLEYRFKKGDWLRIRRSDSIEMTIEEASFTLSPKEDPVAIMKLEEKNMMGENGCGIEWQKPVVKPAEDDKNIMQTEYWGGQCNCRVSIRRDTKNRVIGLIISSAC